jgi:hypothetical protein
MEERWPLVPMSIRPVRRVEHEARNERPYPGNQIAAKILPAHGVFLFRSKTMKPLALLRLHLGAFWLELLIMTAFVTSVFISGCQL